MLPVALSAGLLGSRHRCFQSQASLPSFSYFYFSFSMAILPQWKGYKIWEEGILQSQKNALDQRPLGKFFSVYCFCLFVYLCLFSSCSKECKAALSHFTESGHPLTSRDNSLPLWLPRITCGRFPPSNPEVSHGAWWWEVRSQNQPSDFWW